MHFMLMRLRLSFILVFFILIIGCLGPVKNLYPPEPGDPVKTIYVVSHGWHTGLVLDIKDICGQKNLVPGFFNQSKAIEFGWGDEGFYKSIKFSLWKTVKAALLPTPTVLHLVDLRFSVVTHFPESGVVKIDLSEAGFKNLCDYIESSFLKNAKGEIIEDGPGIYGRSRFYRSHESYFFPKTCNVWTATALRKAGCPITPVYAIRAENVFNQTRKFGMVIQERKQE
jgi:uncharacterized protein (TIGR02117 family)